MVKYLQIMKEYMQAHQTPLLMRLHLTVLVLVISQILISELIEFNDDGEISQNFFEYYGTWIHMLTGMALIPISAIFITVVLKQRGIMYFCPSMSGSYEQVKKDLNELKRFKLPEASAHGIAATVQGLGMGALSLVLLSGILWFIAWNAGVSWSDGLKEVHEFMTGFIEAYVIGHGSMALLHVYFLQKTIDGD
ncbi:MAG TPA: cytochrome b/b6 domain-containing protein [Gammaproteobacteria bacterium]|nr:cytochrome b/b6 domain-containing protein [Gammaproteobacteria bacterium]